MSSGNIEDFEAHRAVSRFGQATGAPLPINLEAEQAVLGAILMNHVSVGDVANVLEPGHFSEDIHRRIFDIALELHKAGKPASLLVMKSYLPEGDLGGGVSVPAYLAGLAADCVAPMLISGMAHEVRDLSIRRDLVGLGEDLSRLARDPRPSLNGVEMAGTTLTALQRIAEAAVAADTRRDAGASAAALIDRARAVMRGEKRDTGVSTGLNELDVATGGGFQPGTLWIVAGRPRMGKTIMATGFARKVAARGARALADGLPGYGSQIFSLEVTEDQIIARILADIAYTSRGKVTFGNIMRGGLDESTLWAVEEAQKRLVELPLALDVAPGLSVQEIAARVRSEKAIMARKGVRLSVVFIDYLKFVRATDRYRGNRVYEVGEISGGLKELAKAEGVCVVLLAQVNRGVDKSDRKDKAPNLSDLRDSGDLEADADVVLFIDRESVRLKQSPEFKRDDPETISRFIELENRADLIIAKTRTGSEKALSIWFDAGASSFAAEARGGVA